MLSFQEQEKVLKPILDKETNKHCADCGSHTPTWASLDFGVFVCSNCSGAHRALGPTITRIKSTKLDQWNKDWVENMRIGNIQINQYWEADLKTATAKKPQTGASLDQHNRYVFDKYLKKKFVFDKNGIDPLKAYKSGKTQLPNGHVASHSVERPKNIYQSQPELEMPSILGLPKKYSETQAIRVTNNVSLLDDGNQNSTHSDHNRNNKFDLNKNGKYEKDNNSSIQQNGRVTNQDDDEFTDYIDPVVNNTPQVVQNNQSHVQAKDPSKLSFDELFKQSQQPAQPQPQTLPVYPNHQQQQQWGHQYPNAMNMNGYTYNSAGMGYNQHMYNHQSHPQYVNQFAHNPYIGYAPHNNLHAAYNMNMNMNYNPY